jgi:OPA family glycerol-3-phosphate transporter-like MFS transporter
MFAAVLNWFKPPPPAPPRDGHEVKRLFGIFRWQTFQCAFLAYATFYLVRNNLSPVEKEIRGVLHYDKDMMGAIIAGTSLAYGVGKFVMGAISDRCDPRKYVFTALILTAGLNFAFGAARNFHVHLVLWTLNGLAQGMGYAPCARIMAHWFSVRERGLWFGLWNMSHNVGGALAGVVAAYSAGWWGWSSAFYVPGAIAIVCAFYLLLRIRDTPQSVGLPSIEEFKNDYPPEETEPHERELTMREIVMKYIFPNKMLWLAAIANFFVYIARYAMVDWGPTYLKETKGASLHLGGWSTVVIELAGAFGMLLMGWLSDKVGGRRGLVSTIMMAPVILAYIGIVLTPAGEQWQWLIMTWFGLIGFCVYTPVMALGVMSLDLTSKKAVGAAAGFVGMFGYFGRFVEGQALASLSQHYSWNAGLAAVIGTSVIATILLAFTWNVRPRG